MLAGLFLPCRRCWGAGVTTVDTNPFSRSCSLPQPSPPGLQEVGQGLWAIKGWALALFKAGLVEQRAEQRCGKREEGKERSAEINPRKQSSPGDCRGAQQRGNSKYTEPMGGFINQRILLSPPKSRGNLHLL